MKVTLADGKEYYVLESPSGACSIGETRCACIPNDEAFCTAAPCRKPPVIFLTEKTYLKRITARLTQ